MREVGFSEDAMVGLTTSRVRQCHPMRLQDCIISTYTKDCNCTVTRKRLRGPSIDERPSTSDTKQEWHDQVMPRKENSRKNEYDNRWSRQWHAQINSNQRTSEHPFMSISIVLGIYDLFTWSIDAIVHQSIVNRIRIYLNTHHNSDSWHTWILI